jgi:hypothetical protein
MIGKVGSPAFPPKFVAIDATRLTPQERDLFSQDTSVILYTPGAESAAPKKTGKKAKNLLFQKPPAPPQWPSQLRLVGVAGIDTLFAAKHMPDYLRGAAELGASGINLAAKAAKMQGAVRLATGLGAAGIFLDGGNDLLRGVLEKDMEALALAGLKGGAGALLLVPGGGLASGGIMLGATALENREWLARQVGQGWQQVSQWLPKPPEESNGKP